MTIRIFIGTSANDEDLEFMATVHYSLEKFASEPLDITWMRLSRDPASFWYSDPQKGRGWRTDGWATPFSALRWGIPAACNYEGKAIYMDLDMVAKADISELWRQEFQNGAGMISKREAICVTMYDNARMKQLLPPIGRIKSEPGLYRTIRKDIVQRPGVIQRYTGGNWNCLDMRRDGGGEYKDIDDPDIKILHFTDIPTQPHLRHAMPRLKREGIKHWYTKASLRTHHRKDALEFYDMTLSQAQTNGYGIENYRNPQPFGDYGR